MGIETVSVLMTDLVGSTAIANRVGPAAAEDLRREHFDLLRGAVERSGGREVKNLGDGLMVVFQSASQALSCAVDIQQAGEARNRRSAERLAVRIGVSLGEATVEDNDYFGEPVIEAARLCAYAQGAQIVVNALARQLGGSRERRSFRSLGRLELKGISEPVPAFELEWEPILASPIALPERLRELPPTGYVGRVAERARLTEWWGEVRRGSLRLVLIGGEAGVGKTRLSTHLALQVHGEGATVLYGRCDEDLGVPYQPWAHALDHFVTEAPRLILDRYVQQHGGDLARLVPALEGRVPALAAPRQSDPETERYLLYAAAAGILEAGGEQKPVLLILDDLHWADSPTLSLLRHVVRAGITVPVMVVGTYRDSDLSRDHPLTSLLADLHREQGVARMKLTGLDSEDLLALMEATAGHELGEDGIALAEEIARETAGNPFFAGELLRHLTESGAIEQDGGRWRLVGDIADLGLPQSVREVVGRRVERLGPDARTALSTAAVIGRDFDIDLLLGVLDVPEAALLDLLEEAVGASLLKESGGQAGRFTFTHALVEYTLYEDLGRTRRARLHRQVAEALELQCGEEPGERLGELASHWAAAVVSSDTAKALHSAQRAAEHALAQLAPDEAVRWYLQALELHTQTPAGKREERCELLVGLGEAQRQTGNPAFRDTLLEAAQLAQELGDTDRLCRAVLANNRGWASSYGGVDSERVRALEAAAGALPQNDPRRARVLALLACELQFAGQPERCRRVAEEAIEIARAAGDPVVLAHTIADAGWAIVVPHTLPERQLMMDELGELARGLDDPRLSFRTATRRMMVGLEHGDRAQAESSLATMRTLAATVPEPFIEYLQPLLEFGWALLQGDLTGSERWAIQAYEVGAAAGQPDAAAFLGAHIFHVRYFQGRAGELVERVMELAAGQDSLSGWRAGAGALALIQSGREDDARELALAEDFQSIPRDEAWSIVMLLWADACSRLRVVDRAEELHELLAPVSGQLAVSGAHVYGSIDWALGALVAATRGACREAEDHFAAAAEIDTRLGAPLLLARTHTRWARALITRGDPEDLSRAQSMLELARDAAERLGADGISQEIAECRAALAATGS
jgi:class 3 adenylate cyclase